MALNSDNMNKKLQVNIEKKGFWGSNQLKQKQIVIDELTKYTLQMLLFRDARDIVISNQEKDILSCLLLGLDKKIETPEIKNAFFTNYTNYILEAASSIQGTKIKWDKNGAGESMVSYNDNGEWEVLTTDVKTSPVEITLYALDIFRYHFDVSKEVVNSKTLSYRRTEQFSCK